MTTINTQSIFYHIYPLGACGAPQQNNFFSEPVNRIGKICQWLDHIQSLGANALYLGPVFESESHGYDTADYYTVDRRLGTHANLQELSQELRKRGIRLVLDGVFNHVGRHFWAFRNLLEWRENSQYKDWFVNVRFDQSNSYGDPFSYECWNGHQSLVELNLANPAVVEHLFGAVRKWKELYQIDGIRLDAADALSFDFMRALRTFTNQFNPELWLMGEVIHGDYRQWANTERLHATTNYELYKGLFSAHNDHNFFELAHSLNRQFSAQGIYRHLTTQYNFADNHDVSRIATQLRDRAHLVPVYTFLFSMPGIPAVYYGSEFGYTGAKTQNDWLLRPSFEPSERGEPDLTALIATLAALRQELPALREGVYQQRHVSLGQLAFTRSLGSQHVLVAANNMPEAATIRFRMEGMSGWRFQTKLGEQRFYATDTNGDLVLDLLPNSAVILVNG